MAVLNKNTDVKTKKGLPSISTLFSNNISTTGHHNAPPLSIRNYASYDNNKMTSVVYSPSSSTRFSQSGNGPIHLPSPINENHINNERCDRTNTPLQTSVLGSASRSYLLVMPTDSIPTKTHIPALPSSSSSSSSSTLSLSTTSLSPSSASSSFSSVPQPLVTPRASRYMASTTTTTTRSIEKKELLSESNILMMTPDSSSSILHESINKNIFISSTPFVHTSSNSSTISNPIVDKHNSPSPPTMAKFKNNNTFFRSKTCLDYEENVDKLKHNGTMALRLPKKGKSPTTTTTTKVRKVKLNRSKSASTHDFNVLNTPVSSLRKSVSHGENVDLHCDENKSILGDLDVSLNDIVADRGKVNIFYNTNNNKPVASHSRNGSNTSSSSIGSNNSSVGGSLFAQKKPSNKTEFAFISHSQYSFSNEKEPDIDNAQLARRKRRRTSKHELQYLENEFLKDPIPNKLKRKELSEICKMSEMSVQIWFQNKRQTLKKKRLRLEKEQQAYQPVP